jgi:hypothetical protein
MSVYNDLKMIFKRITPMQVAANELAEAEFSMLRAETGVEYAHSLVTYNKQRVARLRAYMAAATKAQQKELAKEEV